jgi:hypothetical protein
MVRIRRFGVVRTSNVVALWTLVIGLIILVPFAIILAAAGEMTTTDQFGNSFTMTPGPIIIGFLVGIIFYAGFLWVFTAIGLLIYNLVAGFTGGVEMELVQPPQVYVQGPAWGQPPGYPGPSGSPQPTGAYGQSPGAYGQPPTGYSAAPGSSPQPQAAPPPPPATPWGAGEPRPAVEPPSAVEPRPAVERPTYDPAPRWDAPSPPPDEERREPDRS